MSSFEIDDIFLKHFLNVDMYSSHKLMMFGVFSQIDSIYQIQPLLYFQKSALWTPISYVKMFGSNERLVRFWFPLYPMLLFSQTPFKQIYVMNAQKEHLE